MSVTPPLGIGFALLIKETHYISATTRSSCFGLSPVVVVAFLVLFTVREWMNGCERRRDIKKMRQIWGKATDMGRQIWGKTTDMGRQIWGGQTRLDTGPKTVHRRFNLP